MLAEALFFLLIFSVLIALAVSIKVRISQRPIPARRDLTVEETRYLKYLAYVPSEHAGSSEEPLVIAPPRARPPRRPPAPADDPGSPAGSSPDTAGMLLRTPGPEPAADEAGASSAPSEPAPAADLAVVNVSTERAAQPSVPAQEGPRGALPGGLVAIGADGSPRPQPVTDHDIRTTVTSSRASASTVLLGLPGQGTAPAVSPDPRLAGPESVQDGSRASRRKPRTLHYRHRGPDVWTHWPDATQRHVVGERGTLRLTRAMEVLAKSGANAIADDLVRKGVVVSFGDESEFANAGEHATALLVYSTDDRPPFRPRQVPVIKLNPRHAGEDPRILAAVLVHEGTHFQQYVDGTVFDPSHSTRDAEADAWVNGATFWQEIRTSEGLPWTSELARQEELSYQVARQGEGPLRDLIVALYPLMR